MATAQGTQWRNPLELTEKNYKELLTFITDYEPQCQDSSISIPHANILLIGHVQAGKSSFINTINAAIKQKYEMLAYSQDNEDQSTTDKNDSYHLRDLNKKLKICIFDTIGLHEKESQGLSFQSASAMIDMKTGTRKLQSDFPSGLLPSSERIHTVFFVLDADKCSPKVMGEPIKKQYFELRQKAKKAGIRFGAILTHIDCANKDLETAKIYEDSGISDVVVWTANMLRCSTHDVFPIVNYQSNHDIISMDKNINVLCALKRALELCDISIHENRDILAKHKKTESQIKLRDEHAVQRIRNSMSIDTKEWRNQILHHGIRDSNYNVLLLGPSGCGKSSFINSVASAFTHRLRKLANISNGNTTTKKKKTYRFQGSGLSFQDVRGITPSKDDSLLMEDIKALLEGKIKDGYIFNPQSAIKEDDNLYTSAECDLTKPVVVAFVIGCDVVKATDWLMMCEIKEIAEEKDIRSVAILTKMDQIDSDIEFDALPELKEIVQKSMQEIDVIFVKNYTSQGIPSDESNQPILSAVKTLQDVVEDATMGDSFTLVPEEETPGNDMTSISSAVGSLDLN